MKMKISENYDDDIIKIKTMRTKLESRIESQHNTQIELLSSLQTLAPNIVTSVDQSLKIISLFNNRPFSSTPVPPQNPILKNRHHLKQKTTSNRNTTTLNDECLSVKMSDESEKAMAGKSGNPLMIARSVMAVCLLQRVPFSSIDSSTVLRKLENDQSVTVAEKAALRELGGELGAIMAVEMALRSMAQDNAGVELEEFVVDGKSSVMVLGIDRSRLLKELPESSKLSNINSNSPIRSQKVNNNSGELNMGGYGPGLQVSRPMQDMWSGHGESPHMSRLPPFFTGSGPPGQMTGPMGFEPRLMVTPGMPRGVNIQRPQFGNVSVNGPNDVLAQRLKNEEDALKDCEDLINKKSFKQLKQLEIAKELSDLIHRPTALENAEADKFKTKGGSQVKEYCTLLTKEDCRHKSGSYIACEKVHFRRIVALHTDINLGDCSFLDTCRHMKTCKYVHYELDSSKDAPSMILGVSPQKPLKLQRAEYCSKQELGEAQWINCDIRNFRMDILGQFGVIMADPPWDIHMELPYGTMGDDEMRTLNVQSLQTDGLIFLWVTGRAMELGRECLELWGYKRVEEIIWVKTNQLQRIIRTGRTGHWLNHSKEHCLVGIKGNPEVNRNMDTDVVVAEVRETSRKPDEMYPLLERISPKTRKLELFARMHNTMSGWMSLGNQLPGVRLVDDGLRARFKAAYPDVPVEPASPPRVSAMETDFNAAQARSPLTERIAADTTFASDNKPIPMEIDMAC